MEGRILSGMFNAENSRKLGGILAAQQPFGKDRPVRREAIHAGLDLLLKYKADGSANYEELLAMVEALPFRDLVDQDSRHYLFSVLYDLIYMILLVYQRVSYELLYSRNRSCFSKFPNLLSTAAETWVFDLNHDLYVECLAIDLGIPVTT